MEISVFGLGYVGVVSAACLAHQGHTVQGVDPNTLKVDLLNAGRSPIVERQVGELVRDAVASGRLSATSSCDDAIDGSALAFVCVGTPSQPNGSLDLTYLRRVSEEIGMALARRRDYFVVVVRSTVLPGTTRDVLIPILEERSGKVAGRDFGVCYNPEFLREGSAVRDFYQPPKVVIGASDPASRDWLAQLNGSLDAPIFETDLEVAELIKYADNSWHALKVAFANEIGTLSRAQGVDGRTVMEVFCADEKLNISPAYLRPGFAFGGSCLPKDVRALTHKGRRLDLDLPVLNAILPSNQRQLDRAFDLVVSRRHRRIGILGLSFKPGTDDLRESPMVELVERMLGKGHDIRIYDANVSLASLMGANRDYILNQIPHISELMVEHIDDVLDHAQTIVVGHADPEFDQALQDLREGQRIVDLVRVLDRRSDGTSYEGIGW